MNKTYNIAIENHLSREIYQMKENDNGYLVQVRIKSTLREELSWYYVASKDLHIVPDAAMDLATEAFFGSVSKVSEETVKQIESAIPQNDNKEESNGESNQETDSGKSIETGSKKTRKSRKQEEVKKTESPQAQEEMEEVESPYKETKKEESKVESPKKDKAPKVTAEPYNREDAISKASFASYATKLHGGEKTWKQHPKLKDISHELHGKPFLEKDGSIHPEFDKKAKELFGLDNDNL